MKRSTIDFLLSDRFILTMLGAVICLFTWFYISYNQVEYIEYKYNGIKYQAGHLQSAEPINIEVKGEYVKKLFVKEVEFYGTIKVGESVFTCDPIGFNEYKMGELESDRMMYISGRFEKLTISILEPNQYGGYSFSYRNGWMISAPCTDREDAVKISNALVQRLHRGLVIE
jgi:hypothetical protein